MLPSTAVHRSSVNQFSTASDPSSPYHPRRPSAHTQEFSLQQTNEASIQLHMPYPTQQSAIIPAAHYGAGTSRAVQPSPSPTTRLRYSPYDSPKHASSPSGLSSTPRSSTVFDEGHNIRLAPIRDTGDGRLERRNSAVSLPSISALDGFRQGPCDDSATVLRRLQIPDDQSLQVELSPHSRDTTLQHGLGRSLTHHYP